MKWDNYGLPVKDDDYIKESCKDLALYFIDIFFFRKMFLVDFKRDYPQREQLPEESPSDYDNYLNQHVAAYRDLLKAKNIEYMEDADLHLSDKLTSLILRDKEIVVHPKLGRGNNTTNLLPMLVSLNLYGFEEYLQQDSSNVSVKNAMCKRENKTLRYLSDLYRLFYIGIRNNPEQHLCDLLLAKSVHPTFISKLATKLFFTKYKDFGSIKSHTIKWLTTTE